MVDVVSTRSKCLSRVGVALESVTVDKVFVGLMGEARDTELNEGDVKRSSSSCPAIEC